MTAVLHVPEHHAAADPLLAPLTGALDPIAELRLRRWARERHVPAENRDPRWHPVVWQEMAAKDAERAAAESRFAARRGARRSDRPAIAGRIGPVDPAPVRRAA